MSRNVLNIGDVERFLDDLRQAEESPEVDRWLDRVARRWIIKEFAVAGRILRVHTQAGDDQGLVDIAWANDRETTEECAIPAWLGAALEHGVYWLDLNGTAARNLADELYQILMYFRAIQGTPQFARLDRVSLPSARILAARHHAEQAQLSERAQRLAFHGGSTLMNFPDGFQIVILGTPKELALEGERMRSCVGDYADRIGPEREILSLRDAEDRPHATIEIRKGTQIGQVRGKANATVNARYRPYLNELFKALGIGVNPKQGAPRIGEIETAIDTLSEEVWPFFVDIFTGPDGRLVWREAEEHLDIARESFEIARLRFPLRLYHAARVRRGERARALKRRILDDLGTALVQFCLRDDTTLLIPEGSEHFAGFDMPALRHRHMEGLRRRLARARASLRVAAREGLEEDALLAKWEGNRQRLTYFLHEGARGYF